jgi:hypothetical protein
MNRKRKYCIILAKSEEGLYAAAGDDWAILGNTPREFVTLESNDDFHLNGNNNDLRISVNQPGWVALAYQEVDQ